MAKLSSLSENRREQLSPIKESTAYAKNQDTLNKLGEEEGKLTFNGQPVGGVVERPISEIEIGMWYEKTSTTGQKVLLGADDVDISPALVGREIADVTFILSNETVSIKDMAEKDSIAYISMFNHFVAGEVDDVPVTFFAGIYYPSDKGWLSNVLSSYAINTIKIAYYTD